MTGFYVISGSHGVGKSTVADLVAQLMEGSGSPAAMFHHRAEKAAAGESPTTGSGRPDWLRRVWHLLPAECRAWCVAIADELRYARGVNRKIKDAAYSGKPAISDRYVYDRLVDLRLHGRSNKQVQAVALACRLMRKPDMTFLLTDAPERIHARKDELTIDQIAAYQSDLAALFKRLRVPFTEIPVSGRDADAVARVVIEAIRNPADDAT